MTPPNTKRVRHQIPLESAMAGVLALLVDEREERSKDNKEARKTELILAEAGLSPDDIAAVMDKNLGAVRKAIQRGRGS
jgi:DNA-directed RNA polymerase specialized sigma24 family protein